MKTIAWILFFGISFSLNIRECKAQSADSLRYGILLDSTLADSAGIKGELIHCIDVSPNQLIGIATHTDLKALGWGGIRTITDQAPDEISAFTFTADSALLLISKNKLYLPDSMGKLKPILLLPAENMGISAGKEAVYLFEKNPHALQETYCLYAFARNGKYKKLLASPLPVRSVLEWNKMLLVAIESGIYALDVQTGKLELMLGMQRNLSVISMTADYQNGILYYSNAAGIYAFRDGKISYVTGDFGAGLLKYFEGGIVIFNPLNKNITRITGISNKIEF